MIEGNNQPADDPTPNRVPPLEEELSDSMRVLPVIEEVVHLDKRVIETGKVTIAKKTVEHDETVNMLFRYDDVQVERVEVNRYLSADEEAPEMRQEGDTTVVPVLKEVVVVEKRLLLVEELRITRRQVERPFQTTVTLRKEEVTVTRSEPDRPGANPLP
jgi:uncharacterized protein (TIGR02271 family)